MKCLLLVAVAVSVIDSSCGRPGGYTGIGGVYKAANINNIGYWLKNNGYLKAWFLIQGCTPTQFTHNLSFCLCGNFTHS